MARMPTPLSTQTRVTLPRNVRVGGVAEIAAEIKEDPTNVSTILSRRVSNGCPAPLFSLRMGSVFDLDAWAAWHALGRKRHEPGVIEERAQSLRSDQRSA